MLQFAVSFRFTNIITDIVQKRILSFKLRDASASFKKNFLY